MNLIVLALCATLALGGSDGLHGLHKHLFGVVTAGEARVDAVPEPCRLDVCVALDASSGQPLTAERRVSLALATALLQRDARSWTRIAAVQFGTIARMLSPLTSDLDQFRQSLSNREDVGDARNSESGFLGCRVLLDERNGGRGNKKKAIVVMVGGDATIGGSLEDDVRGFRAAGGTVIVLVNSRKHAAWMKKLSDGPGTVLVVPGLWRKEQTISASRKVLEGLCSSV